MTKEELLHELDGIVPKNPKSDWSKYQRTIINIAIKVLEQEPRWIPVGERLPKEDGRYLVTVQNLTGYEHLDNNVFECEFFNTDWIFKGWKDNEVIAWMPLPKEYKAESEE